MLEQVRPRLVQSALTLGNTHSLWLHGAGLSGATWRKMTASLPHASTPDLPWHGSAVQVTPPTVESFAACMLPKLSKNSIVIGHSLGGMVALELAARAPDRVSALVLIESVPSVGHTLIGRFISFLALQTVRHISPKTLGRLAGVGQTPETRAELLRQLSSHSTQSLAAAMQAAASYDGRATLGRIRAPTLIVVGRDNGATHKGARLATKMIETAELVTLPGGHMLHHDNPVQLRRTIDIFLKRVL